MTQQEEIFTRLEAAQHALRALLQRVTAAESQIVVAEAIEIISRSLAAMPLCNSGNWLIFSTTSFICVLLV